MPIDVPPEHHDLLGSAAVAVVTTIGRHGEPHSSPLWFHWDGASVRFSLVEGRQKLRNLRRDPRLAVVVIDPARPTHYVELRGTVDLTPDPTRELERRVAGKYGGSDEDSEAPGTMRYAATVAVDRITAQRGI
jgi:PPOX class probable F420-dependent enzyme